MATWSRPGEGWTRDPFGAEIVDGWMYGRGVAVSKSDFATYAWALLALQAAEAAGDKLAGTIELHFTYDEEAGGEIGPGWLLSEGITRPDYALSAGFSYGVVTAHNGCLHLEVQVDGRSAHAAMPYTGVDALEARHPHPVQSLRVAQDAVRTPVRHRRHRQPAAHGRADQGRDQHQRGAGPRHFPPRPPDGSGGAPGGRGSRTEVRHRNRGQGTARSPGRRSAASCSPSRWFPWKAVSA